MNASNLMQQGGKSLEEKEGVRTKTVAGQKPLAVDSTKKQRCCERVRVRGLNWPTFQQCKRRAVVTRDGKPYCKVHDPKAVQERRDKQIRAFTNRINRNVFGGYATAMFELLKESQKSISSDWRERRDELIAKIQDLAPSDPEATKRYDASGASSPKSSIGSGQH